MHSEQDKINHQVNAVIQRLAVRAKLMKYAKEIIVGVNSSLETKDFAAEYVGEAVKGTGCVKEGNEGKEDETIFECAQNAFACISFDKGMGDFECNKVGTDYDCTALIPTGYDCESESSFRCSGKGNFECLSESAYSTCGTDKNKFDCSSDEYNCGGGDASSDKNYYDCHDFNCKGVDGDKKGFDCNSDVDFICGELFECQDDFDCTAGHVFSCMLDHDCGDSFTCDADARVDCEGEYPYTNPHGPDPGDFTCGAGLPWKGTDDFDCTDLFECKAVDQFDCSAYTNFDCGDGEGGADSFSCDTTGSGSKAGFSCTENQDFECTPIGNFSCTRGTDYACTSPTGKYEISS